MTKKCNVKDARITEQSQGNGGFERGTPTVPNDFRLSQALQRIFSTVPDTRVSTAAKETVVLWLACTIPGLALLTCFFWVFPGLFAGGAERLEHFLRPRTALIAITLGPAVETIGLALTVWALRWVLGHDRKVSLVLLSAAVWAVLHGLDRVGWALGVFWPFIVFTTAFVRWEPRGFMRAFLVTAVVHALHNFSLLLVSAAGARL